MAIGIIILAHHHLHRTRQLAKALASRNVRVAIHIDADTSDTEFDELRKSLSNNSNIIFANRVSCDWGAFSLVEAGLGAAEMMLKKWPGITHVAQISGSCLPIRPIEELNSFLDENIGTDFVESYCAQESGWVVGGLSAERFTLYFPFSWRKQRWLFDRAVEVQRTLRVSRKIPDGLQPCVGSQWWCLSNATLRAILSDPQRNEYDRFFKRCWIPDEGYVPTLVRKHSKNLVTTSLTLSKFDDQGKPHIFYDDHAPLLQQCDQFFARKVWHGAEGLYRNFLKGRKIRKPRSVADDLGLETLFTSAREKRCVGRNGRLTAGRFPAAAYARQPATCRSYGVLIGLGHVFHDLQTWLAAGANAPVHGRLFKHNAVPFAKVGPQFLGGIPDNPKVRDVNPEQFLCNLIWNGRETHQSLMFEHSDGERIGQFLANDRNANIAMLKGGWLLELLTRKKPDHRLLRHQARKLSLQEKRLEHEFHKAGRQDIVFVSLHDLIVDPAKQLDRLTSVLGPVAVSSPAPVPQFRDLSGLRMLVSDFSKSGVNTDAIGHIPDYLPGEPHNIRDDALFAFG